MLNNEMEGNGMDINRKVNFGDHGSDGRLLAQFLGQDLR